MVAAAVGVEADLQWDGATERSNVVESERSSSPTGCTLIGSIRPLRNEHVRSICIYSRRSMRHAGRQDLAEVHDELIGRIKDLSSGSATG
jgi:hypothetical protein